MTTSTQTDDEIQAQWARAADALEKRLRPYMQDLIRGDFARQFIHDLAEQGFRPPLRPPKRAGVVDPESARVAAARGAELARRLTFTREEGAC